MPIDIDSENEFDKWLDSIKFIDEKGKIIKPILTEDKSSDPQNDRE